MIPFVESSSIILSEGNENWNDRPGVAVFDFGQDGDLDLYITQKANHSNRLYRNDGNGVFTDIAKSAGVELISSHSTGVMTCDLDNDGMQDLYVGAWGDPEDQLGFRSPSDIQGNIDTLFLNQGGGKFVDISDQAFGESRNVRSATSISCADINNDGWLDLYVANVGAHDFRTFNSPSHPGHVNVLYLNNHDLTFTEIAEEVGLAGSEIRMRSTSGEPILFKDPKTGETYEGWDPMRVDRLGNQVGEPVPQTHATLFFDFDDDLDVDLFMADDGDTLKIYKNDSVQDSYLFKHIITRDVAYNTLLKSNRKIIHGIVGKLIEDLFSDSLEIFYYQLAEHFDKGEITDKAMKYLELSGIKAQTLFDNIQAKKFYMRLLEVDNNNDIEYKSDIQIKLCEVLQILGDWDECEKMIKEVIDSIKDVSEQKHDWACG